MFYITNCYHLNWTVVYQSLFCFAVGAEAGTAAEDETTEEMN